MNDNDIPSDFLASGSLDSSIRRLAGDLTGKQIGHYQIAALIGVGGMGEVYRAHDGRLVRDVAIKVLPPAFTADPARRARFEREALLLARINHPNIATIYSVENVDGAQAIVLELVEGETLRERLQRGPLPVSEALRYAEAIANALEAAHEKGVIHRDLKPANIKVTPSGRLKVLDFGLARVESGDDADAHRTHDGMIVGTAAYMSPEQARGQAVDKRTDIWAFGCLLFEMLSGQPPFAGANVSDIMVAVLEKQPNWSALPPNIPESISRLLHRCLEKDSRVRLRDVGDARPELADALNAPSGVPASGKKWAITRQIYWAAIALLVGVAAGLPWMLRSAPTARRDLSQRVNPLASIGTHSVVVLPFNWVGDGDMYLADGITESVARELGKVDDIRVIAANSAFAYRGDQNAQDVGRELHARLLVRGSVQRVGDRIRVNAALVDTARNETLWGDRHDRLSRDVLTAQDDIAWQIASRVAAAIGRRGPERRSDALTTTSDAYDAYLRARSHMRGRSGVVGRGKRYAAAIEEFERSLSFDNGFALAHAGLATAYTQRFFFDTTDRTFEQKALVAIEKALAINSDQAEVYLARAQLVWNLGNGFPHERAIADLRHALALNPNLADAHIELGRIYHHIGLLEKSIASIEEALRQDPLATLAARRRLQALNDGRMRQYIQDVLARNPRWLTPMDRAEALLALDDVVGAERALAEHKAAMTGSTISRDMEPNEEQNDPPIQAQVFARLKRHADARRVLEKVIPRALNPTGLSHVHHAQFIIGCTFALLGESDRAVEWLTRAANEGYPSYPKFSAEPDLASLKVHPGFVRLLARLQRDFEQWRASL